MIMVKVMMMILIEKEKYKDIPYKKGMVKDIVSP
jgi:hypothetical protein